MSGIDLNLVVLPRDFQEDLAGRTSPVSLCKLSQVSTDLQKIANFVAGKRLIRSFGGATTDKSHAQELLKRSFQPSVEPVEAYAKLGNVTAVLQTRNSCVVSLKSPFSSQHKEMVILTPPAWDAIFPLEQTVSQIISFRQEDTIVFTENGFLEKYNLRLGRTASIYFGPNTEVLQTVGEEAPFVFLFDPNNCLKVLLWSNFRIMSEIQTEKKVRAILNLNGRYRLFYQDTSNAILELDQEGVIKHLTISSNNSFSQIARFKAVSSNSQESFFTVETYEGSSLVLLDHKRETITNIMNKMCFEKIIRVQEHIIGLHNNCIYDESIVTHNAKILFSPAMGTILDFCASEEGVLRVIVQQLNRLLLTKLIFRPYKKLFVNSEA